MTCVLVLNYTLVRKLPPNNTHKHRMCRVSTHLTPQKENIKLRLSRSESVGVKLRGNQAWLVPHSLSHSNHTERLHRVKTRDLTVLKRFSLQLYVLVPVRLLSQQRLERSLSPLTAGWSVFFFSRFTIERTSLSRRQFITRVWRELLFTRGGNVSHATQRTNVSVRKDEHASRDYT